MRLKSGYNETQNNSHRTSIAQMSLLRSTDLFSDLSWDIQWEYCVLFLRDSFVRPACHYVLTISTLIDNSFPRAFIYHCTTNLICLSIRLVLMPLFAVGMELVKTPTHL